MPQVFGPASPGDPKVLNPALVLYNPRKTPRRRVQFRRDMLPLLARANSLYVPSGRWPVRGWLLLRRGDYNQINPYATNLALRVEDFTHAALTFNNLTVVQARCVTTGIAADPNALYLVEVTDRRGILANQWFAYPTTSQYNVVAPAYPGQYYDSSLAFGVPWTWDGLVSNLWGQLGLGAYPGLPFAPAGTPENWLFPGEPGWLALCRVLDHLGMTVTCDPTQASPYGIVQLGAADAAFDARTAQYAGLLEDDLEWLDTGSGRVPGSVTVYFHTRYNRGAEEDVRRDSLQWSSAPLYAITVAAPAPYNAAAGTGYLWDDYSIRRDPDGVPMAADVAAAVTIAAERVTEFFRDITSGTLGYLDRTYAGVLPFVTGSRAGGVCWKQDFRRGVREGWRTQVVRGSPPWPEVYGEEEEAALYR